MKRMSRLRFGALALLAGCATSPSTPPTTPTPSIASNATSSPHAALVDRIVAARGLRPMRPIVIRDLDDAEYADTYLRFDRDPPPAGSRAFLDRKDSVIYTRGASDDRLTELIVTALLNQYFSYQDRVDRLAAAESIDAANALDGLGIADTNLVRLLLSGPDKHELAAHVAKLSAMSPDAAVAAGRLPPALLKESDATIRTVMAKQSRSLGFIARLYLAGGWELVNRAWATPPTQVAELGDPKSYLDGTRARSSLPPIPAIPDTTLVEKVANMSAPQVYGFLADLFARPAPIGKDTTSAIVFSDAQRGMSLRIVDRNGYGRAFVVVAAWDSAETATRFVARWLEQPKTASDCGPIAKQRGHAVVAALCLGAVPSAKWIDELLPKIGDRTKPEPPLGTIALPRLEEY